MTCKQKIEDAVKNAVMCKGSDKTPEIITGHPVDAGMRWSGGHGIHHNNKYWRVINIRHADGSKRNEYASLITYEDGDLICDLVEDTSGYPEPPADIDKLIAIAYYMGREQAAKEICDIHNKRIAAAREKANQARYYKLANSILDAMGGDIIYTADYSGDITNTFGDDPA